MTAEEHLCGHTLVLRYDARERLMTVKLRGVRIPWLDLDPTIPRGKVHWLESSGDASVWRDGVHYESTGGPWESERETRKPYEQFVAEELAAMRLRLVASVDAVSLPWMREVFAYLHAHRLVGRGNCHVSHPRVNALVRELVGRVKDDELSRVRAALADMGAESLAEAREVDPGGRRRRKKRNRVSG